MSLFAPLIVSLCLLSFSSIFSPAARAASAKDITAALDAPASVEFSASTSGWSKSTGSISKIVPKGIPSVNSTYLMGTSPGKANPQNQISFSLKVRGAGTLSFRYQVSLDGGNGAELCAYEGNYDEGSLWGDSGYWDENFETGWDWWWEDEFDLFTDTYTHTVTFAILGPLYDEFYEKPELDSEWGEKLYNKAWLDRFVWEPDLSWQIMEFFPDPETDNAFDESVTVSLNSDYDNISFRYTTDGSTPTMNSPLYDPWEHEGIDIFEKTTIKAIAIENNQQIDDTIYEATYLLKTKAPDFTLTQNDLQNAATVNFSSETPEAQFYYTRNGQPPIRLENGNPGENTFNESTVTLTGTTTVQAMAWAEGLVDSIIITNTYEKLTSPEISFSLDNNTRDNNTSSTHPYFDNNGSLTLTAPQDTTIKYQINDGEIKEYTSELDFNDTTEIRFQAQQEGKLYSDVVTQKFYKTTEGSTLSEPAASGWNLFFLPGEVSEQTSADLILKWKPIAYDSQKKIYVRPDLLRGGNSYWIFTPQGGTRTEPSNFPIYPLEGITLPSKTWFLSGIPDGATLPTSIQVQIWNGKTFQPVSLPPASAAWLYNTDNSPIELQAD